MHFWQLLPTPSGNAHVSLHHYSLISGCREEVNITYHGWFLQFLNS